MQLPLYVLLLLFVIHSALLIKSDAIAILAIFMFVLLLCAFLTCLAERYLISAKLRPIADGVELVLKKKGFLPVYFIRSEIGFVYDQTGEADEEKDHFVLYEPESTITFRSDLKYAGSGVFRMKKLSVSDYFGFFSLPVRDLQKIQTEIDLFPAEADADIYTRNNRVTGTPSDNSFTVDLIGDDPSETLQIREYHPGDMISRTHWKLTAKRDIMMTRDFARESDSQYLFVLSFGEKTQEKFHKIVSNYYVIANALLKRSMNHTVLWSDGNADIFEEQVNSFQELEDTMYLIFHSFEEGKEKRTGLSGRLFDFLKQRKNDEADASKLFTPYSGEIIMEEYAEKSRNAFFIKQFIITDEPIYILQERWSEDEE